MVIEIMLNYLESDSETLFFKSNSNYAKNERENSLNDVEARWSWKEPHIFHPTSNKGSLYIWYSDKFKVGRKYTQDQTKKSSKIFSKSSKSFALNALDKSIDILNPLSTKNGYIKGEKREITKWSSSKIYDSKVEGSGKTYYHFLEDV